MNQQAEEKAYRNMEDTLSLWIWNTDWKHPSPEDIGRLREFFDDNDMSPLDQDEQKLISKFLDENLLDSQSYKKFMANFDIPAIAGMAGRCILQDRDIDEAGSRKVLYAKTPNGEIELIAGLDGSLMECNWIDRQWGGDVRIAIPGDAARAICENSPLAAPLAAMTQNQNLDMTDNDYDDMRMGPKP